MRTAKAGGGPPSTFTDLYKHSFQSNTYEFEGRRLPEEPEAENRQATEPEAAAVDTTGKLVADGLPARVADNSTWAVRPIGRWSERF